jgi:MerR family transcriptional regulator, copper efflux regulator
MNISEAAKASGLPVKTLRYYETIGLVVPGRQEANEYRDYIAADVETLVLLRRARSAGFSLAQCRELLAHSQQSGAQGQAFLTQQLGLLDSQLQELQQLRAHLAQLQQESTSMAALDELPPLRPMSFMLVEPLANTAD